MKLQKEVDRAVSKFKANNITKKLGLTARMGKLQIKDLKIYKSKSNLITFFPLKCSSSEWNIHRRCEIKNKVS